MISHYVTDVPDIGMVCNNGTDTFVMFYMGYKGHVGLHWVRFIFFYNGQGSLSNSASQGHLLPSLCSPMSFKDQLQLESGTQHDKNINHPRLRKEQIYYNFNVTYIP